MLENEQCSVQDCGRRAATVLCIRSFCREHFISTCRAELEANLQRLKESRSGEISAEAARRFIHECMWQADYIEHSAEDLDDLERERLLDIILSAAELGRHLRRSPRVAASIPLRVRSEEPGEPWEEDTQTQLISRYGALVRFQHSLEMDERLHVVRKDNGREAHARVAWYRRKREDRPDVGIEFLDSDNFWGLDWSKVEGNI